MKERFIKQKIVSFIFSRLPLHILAKLTRANPIISYYHMINDEEVLHIKHLYVHKNVRQFKDDLDFLLERYSLVSLFDIMGFLKNGCSLPEKAFLLTFDDGFREMQDVVAPILLEKGVPATFFLNSDFIDNKKLCYLHKASLLVEKIHKGISPGIEGEIRGILVKMGLSFSELSEGILKVDYRRRDVLDRIAKVLIIDFQRYLNEKQPYLTSCQVRALIDQGFTIGAHSIDHPNYSTLSLAEQLEQTIMSIKHIREKFKLDYGAFAFPHNDNGVSREFFKKVKESSLIDITFGTGGMLDGGLQSHRQRISLENSLVPAREIIAWQYIRKLYKQLRRNSKRTENC